jgi:ParB family transcriptional regulator, chromosome partitioning protein
MASLKTLAESKTDGIQKSTQFKVRPDVVTFEPGFNLRDEGPELDAYIDQLEAAMRAGAYIPPIDVAVIDDKIVARDGHCRTRAALRIDGYLLEARQVRGNEIDAVYHMMGSDQKRNFSQVERARGYLRLINMGQDVATIAQRTGLHRSTIENFLSLAEAPAAVQNLVKAGTVSASLAVKTVRESGSKATDKLNEAVAVAKAKGKTKATAKHVARPAAQPTPDARAMLDLVRRLAAVSVIATPNREQIALLVTDARNILGIV